jgi:cytoskeletal protein CcmA (bactofilin family)
MFGRDRSVPKQQPERQTAGNTGGSTIGSNVNGNVSSQPVGAVPVTNAKIDTVIGSGCRMNGILQSDGGVRVDGVFDGTIQIQGNLVVGETATIVADIQAYNITVSGTIKGNITANKIEIMETGKVWGDLNVNSLLLNEGAFLRGNTNMNGDMEPPAIEAPKVGSPRLVAPPDDDENL